MEHIVFKCVIPYICDGDDRKSFSLVCREWYDLDSLTRQQLTVQLFYVTTLSSYRLPKRFPFLKSLMLEGLEYLRALHEPRLDITFWIKEIVTSFNYLDDLELGYVQIEDYNLELLAKTRGKQLRRLRIFECDKFSTDGLKHICHHCINLRTLHLEFNDQIIIKDAEWLHELALHNTCIKHLIFYNPVIDFNVNDLTLLAKNCNQSLECVQITSKFSILDLKDFFNSAVMLKDFLGCDHSFKTKEDYVGFEYPPNMQYMELERCASKDELGLVVPLAHQLIQLRLHDVKQDDQLFLLERCPKLETLWADNIYGNKGLQLIARFCKNLRTLIIDETYVSCMGLITLAQGCLQLECLHIKLEDISEKALGCLGAHLKNLKSFYMNSSDMTKRSLIPTKGIRALLIGCTKLEKLTINLVHRRLTRESMENIGKYGHELRHLSLNFRGIPGLKKLSKGCPKLRVVRIKDCEFSKEEVLSFVFNNITSLRYINVWNEEDKQYLTTIRPDFEQVLL